MATDRHIRGDFNRRGQAVVEFALILPLFLLLVFGAIEFGRVMVRIHLLTNAAREGARIGTLPGNLESEVHQRIDDFLVAAGMASGTWTRTVVIKDGDGVERAGGLADAQQGDHVEVSVSHNFQVLTGSIVPGLSGIIPLNATCVFRHE